MCWPDLNSSQGSGEAVEKSSMDTMTVMEDSAYPMKTEQHTDDKAVKLMLSPSQVQKLQGQLILLSHARHLVSKLIDECEEIAPCRSFLWRTQLLYSFVQENNDVHVSVSCSIKSLFGFCHFLCYFIYTVLIKTFF